MTASFMRRRWVDFRNGHSTYLSVTLNIVNFILIVYGFQVANLDIFPNVWLFGIVAVAVYMPLATLLGVMHRKYQYHVDNTVLFEQNPALASTLRHIIEQQKGDADPKKTDEIIDYLKKIERKTLK